MEATMEVIPAPLRVGMCGSKKVATGAIYWGFASLGLLIASLGPALLGLQRQTGASAEELSFVFTLRSLGYLLGSAGSGFLLDKFPKSGTRGLALCLFLTATCTGLIPFVGSVVALGALCSTQGAAMGVLDTVGNVLIIFLHGENAGPWMQGLHFVFAVGALSSPLFVRASMALSETSIDASAAFYLFAAITSVGGVWFSFVPTPPPRKTEEHNNAGNDSSSGSLDRSKTCCGVCSIRRGIILTTGALLGLYVGAETGFGGFVLLFSQNQFGSTEAAGQYMNAVFWGCIAIGRGAAIPISLWVSVTKQLWTDVFVSLAGWAMLVLSIVAESEGLLWVGCAVYGLGMASVFPCAVMQAEAYVDLSGRAV